MPKELRHIRIHGKVQGVGYRFFATRVARRLGLKGWIQNNRDGTVEAMVEGEKASIDEWVEEIREGPRYAEVPMSWAGWASAPAVGARAPIVISPAATACRR